MRTRRMFATLALFALIAGTPSVGRADYWVQDSANPSYVNNVPYKSPTASGSGYTYAAGGAGGDLTATSTGNIAGVTAEFGVTVT